MTVRVLGVVWLTAAVGVGVSGRPAPGEMAVRAPAAASGAATPVVVELFTSEGCSSCPPADRLLMDLIATQPVPGALVIGLSEHVDYWDRLGWRDPFSNGRFSERQRAYAAAAHTTNVYTPQMIVDGDVEFVGSDGDAALRAIAHAARAPKPALQLAWIGPANELRVDVPPNAVTAGADVLVGIIEDGLSSDVRAGENEGHRLAHAAVVRDFRTTGHAGPDGAFHQTIRPDVQAGWQRSRIHVVVFLQETGHRGVLAAATIVPPK